MNKHTVFEQVERQAIIHQLNQVSSLSEMEQRIRQILQSVGNLLLHVWIMWLTPRYNAPCVMCPYCAKPAAV